MPDANPQDKPGELVAAAIDTDSELLAIRSVLSALVPLKRESRTRVLDYVFKRLGLVTGMGQQGSTDSIAIESPSPAGGVSSVPMPVSDQQQDIRSLTEQRSPKSANEMAALVAYYLAEVAPEQYRKQAISSDDIKTYFKQARFKLPSSAKMTLVNAKNSGYLESTGTAGFYKLNPVGYNLIVHSLLPRSDKKSSSRKPRKKPQRGRK